MEITEKERIIMSAFTGIMLTKDTDGLMQYMENLLQRSVFTHELSSSVIWQEIKEKSKPDFLNMMKVN
ncbi:MAG: hypothetical protein ACRCR5_08235 [Lactococcus garvieae]